MGIDLKDLPESARREAERQIREQDQRLVPVIMDDNVRAPLEVDRTVRPRRTHSAPKPRTPNRWEQDYAARLELLRSCNEVKWFAFEPIKLRLATLCFYTPDFGVWMADDSFEFHEVKGHWEEDAKIKYRIAREQFPMFKFRAFTKLPHGGGWKELEI
jgi:hypothetical protein